MKQNNRWQIKVAGFTILFVLLTLAINFFIFWFVGSAATSAIKVVNNQCGKTYEIENFARGNWFCPKDK